MALHRFIYRRNVFHFFAFVKVYYFVNHSHVAAVSVSGVALDIRVHYERFLAENITMQDIVGHIAEYFAPFAMNVNLSVTILRERRHGKLRGGVVFELYINHLMIDHVVVAFIYAFAVFARL